MRFSPEQIISRSSQSHRKSTRRPRRRLLGQCKLQAWRSRESAELTTKSVRSSCNFRQGPRIESLPVNLAGLSEKSSRTVRELVPAAKILPKNSRITPAHCTGRIRGRAPHPPPPHHTHRQHPSRPATHGVRNSHNRLYRASAFPSDHAHAAFLERAGRSATQIRALSSPCPRW